MFENDYLTEIRNTARDVTIAGKLGHKRTENRLNRRLEQLMDSPISSIEIRIAGAQGTLTGLMESGCDEEVTEFQTYIDALINKRS